MKQTYLTILLFLFVSSAIFAQQTNDIALQDINISKSGDELLVSFKANIGKKAVNSNYKLVLTPVLSKEQKSKRLKQIVVYTRKSRIVQRREQISAGKRAVDMADEYRATTKSTVHYALALPYEDWMNGADLRLDRLTCGCCTEAYDSPLVLAQNVSLLPPAVEVEPVQPPFVPKQYQWNFSKKDMTIDFTVSKTDINFDLFGNRELLAEIVKAVETIQSTRDTSLDKIQITGYASPEGRRDINHALGENRAIALREYLKEQLPGLTDADFELINGGENWGGLRGMVATSEMKEKERVLYIIDNVPAEVDLLNNTSRKKQLMELKGGTPYRYMAKNFFPRLRNACYIGVYYRGRQTIN